MTHTPTPWKPDMSGRPQRPHSEDWDCICVKGFALSSGPETDANTARIVAAVNFFHGSKIKTEDIPVGGINEIERFIRLARDIAPNSIVYDDAEALLTKLGVDR